MKPCIGAHMTVLRNPIAMPLTIVDMQRMLNQDLKLQGTIVGVDCGKNSILTMYEIDGKVQYSELIMRLQLVDKGFDVEQHIKLETVSVEAVWGVDPDDVMGELQYKFRNVLKHHKLVAYAHHPSENGRDSERYQCLYRDTTAMGVDVMREVWILFDGKNATAEGGHIFKNTWSITEGGQFVPR